MKLLSTVRRSMSWKLLLSYLLIIVVAFVVLIGVAYFHTDTAIQHHIADMEAALHGGPEHATDLTASFHEAINEVILVGALAGVAAAVVVSAITTTRIVGPLRAMMQASRRIAAGDYHQRVRSASQDELGDLASSFNRMAETLEQTEQRRLALIGNVAHELRTPLTSIRGVMEGMMDGVIEPDAATLLSVQREVTRLQRLVGDLEQLSRAEAGQIPLHRQPVEPAGLITAAASRLQAQFDDKGVELAVELPDALPPVTADAERITQVLLNLLGNALQYTPAGGRVAVQAGVQRDAVLVSVRDDGIGIAEDDLLHIFERFYRVDKSRSRAGGGSGIGLTIAKHLVEAHGGQIWAESPGAGRGSTFTFSLPLAS
jgi:signal transduction histidine kinase